MEAGSRGLVHLMPRRCLARLPFVAESAGQTQRMDRTLQDALCASASHRQQDKAIICPDTSLACSPQLARGTVDCRAPGFTTAAEHRRTPSWAAGIKWRGRRSTCSNTSCTAPQTFTEDFTLGLVSDTDFNRFDIN